MPLPESIVASQTGHIDHHEQIHDFVNNVVSPFFVTSFHQDAFASRPAASVKGRLYRATDTGNTYVDTGTAWEEIGLFSGFTPSRVIFGGAAGEPAEDAGLTYNSASDTLTVGANVSSSQLTSTIATGTAPLVVASTTLVTNLNADTVDGLHASQLSGSGHDHDSTYVNETDHTTAAHDALNIDADTLDGLDSTAFSLTGHSHAETFALADLSDVTAKTGTGAIVVMDTSPTIVTPTIASFANAAHTHQDAAGGAKIDHGAALDGLTDDDHTQYLLATGSRAAATLTVTDLTSGRVPRASTAGLLVTDDDLQFDGTNLGVGGAPIATTRATAYAENASGAHGFRVRGTANATKGHIVRWEQSDGTLVGFVDNDGNIILDDADTGTFPFRRIKVGNSAHLWSALSGDLRMAANLRFDGTNYRYIENGGGVDIVSSIGPSFSVFVAPTGTAGDIASPAGVIGADYNVSPRLGFYGVSLVTRQTIAAAASDPTTTQTLANDLRSKLINLGLVQA